MATLDVVRQQLEHLLEQAEQNCALAMEQAAARAAEKLAEDRQALIAYGRQIERERWLLMIELQLEHLRADGRNALALHALRRMALGEDEGDD